MPRSLFFDLDGTLTDPKVGITRCIRHALEGLGVGAPSDTELERWIGPPLAESFRELLGPSPPDLVERAMTLYRERFGTLGMFENVPYPGISDGLRELAGSRRLYVVTSKPTLYARRIVEHFDLSRYFVAVYGSEMSGERTHKGELIAYVLHAEGIAPNDAIMIGDRSHDILGARQNEVTAVGVLWGYGSREELVEAGASAVYASVTELVEALGTAR
jgi:phosphoglycolate phosphatase